VIVRLGAASRVDVAVSARPGPRPRNRCYRLGIWV